MMDVNSHGLRSLSSLQRQYDGEASELLQTISRKSEY
jgi:hypothetical protein